MRTELTERQTVHMLTDVKPPHVFVATHGAQLQTQCWEISLFDKWPLLYPSELRGQSRRNPFFHEAQPLSVYRISSEHPKSRFSVKLRQDVNISPVKLAAPILTGNGSFHF